MIIWRSIKMGCTFSTQKAQLFFPKPVPEKLLCVTWHYHVKPPKHEVHLREKTSVRNVKSLSVSKHVASRSRVSHGAVSGNTVSIGSWPPTFSKTVMPPFSNVKEYKHYGPSKCHEQLTQRHTVTIPEDLDPPRCISATKTNLITLSK